MKARLFKGSLTPKAQSFKIYAHWGFDEMDGVKKWGWWVGDDGEPWFEGTRKSCRGCMGWVPVIVTVKPMATKYVYGAARKKPKAGGGWR